MSRRLSVAVATAATLVSAVGLAWNATAQQLERQMAELVPPPATKNPFSGNAAAVEEGRNIYNQTCTTCHGANGAAGEFAPGLAIAGRAYAIRSDEQIFNTIKNGIAGTPMPAHGGRLSDDQIWKVTAYIYGLRGTAIDAPLPGDVAHGREVFFGKGACASCHMVEGKGSVIGPDLSNIAAIRKTASISDALTKAHNRVYPPGGYQSYQLTPIDTYPVVRVTTADGRTVRGVLRNEDSYSIQVMGLDQKLHLFQRRGLKSVVYEPERLMPADYDKRLTPAEFADLMAFLTRQAGSRPRVAAATARRPAAD